MRVCHCRGIYQTIPVYGSSENVVRQFSEGTQFVEYKVVDEAGNFERCSFYVTIRGVCALRLLYTLCLDKKTLRFVQKKNLNLKNNRIADNMQ